MKRVMIVGCCGAGKSTFAKKLNEKLNLEVIHLDQHYWKPNWVETEKKEWEEKVKVLAAKEEWIMDGNYAGTMDIRLERADTVFYLDVSTIKCLSRVLKRIRKYEGTTRPDMPPGCNERYDFDFLHYVAMFNLTRRKKILEKLQQQDKSQIEVIIIKDDRDIEKTLEAIF